MTHYEVGTGLAEITAFKKDIGMMGYGMHWNTVTDIETPLLARAFLFRSPDRDQAVGIVICDMCFVSQAVKSGVMKKLRRKHPEIALTEASLMLLAQHTHSGPGGYNHYGLYNISVPGFVPEVYQQIVAGITEAIRQAWNHFQPAKLRFSKGEFAPNPEIASNRSMKAYLRNPEAQGANPKRPEMAVDRTMRLLRMDRPDGTPIGAINWLGVHTTSVHNDNHSICWDNKGYAADYLERELREKSGNADFLGAFAQGAAGDVTPNYQYDKKKKWTRGRYADDFASARHNGRLQYEVAREIHQNAAAEPPVAGNLDSGLLHVNFSDVLCDPVFTNGVENARTAAACHGVAFFAGTQEGPGMVPVIVHAARFMAWWVKQYEKFTVLFQARHQRRRLRHKYAAHGKKVILIEAGERRVLGTAWVKGLVVPGFADPTIRYFKRLHPRGWDEDKPWVPHVLPLQIVTLGSLAIVGLPAEATTIAGQRLRQVVEKELAAHGIHEVIIAPYANAYCGYLTTREEYDVQAYEGGHTVFGQWTLAAFQTKLRSLAREMAKLRDARQLTDEVRPPEFSEEELRRRTYHPSL
ncbi:MAG: neutral/alkaline non-lysosomal ceramidase N-terminal domain-containing protein [Bacteroidota bacterium]